MDEQKKKMAATGYGSRRSLLVGAAFLAALSLLVLIRWLGDRTLTELQVASDVVARTYQVIGKLQEILTDLSDAETGERDFIILGDVRHLELYGAAVAETDKDLTALKGLMDDARARRKLVEIEAAARERLAVLEVGIEIRKTQGLQAAGELILSGRGKGLMDKVRSLIDEAIALEMDLLQQRSALQSSKTTKVKQTRRAGSLLAIALLGAVFTFLNREITRRGRVERELEGRQQQLYAALEERTRVNEALRQSEQRFTAFMLHLPAAAWVKDTLGRYVYGNKEHEHVFFRPFSEYAGLRDDEFLPPETAAQFRENDKQVLADGESLQTIEVLRQADGIEHHLIVSKFPIPGPDGNAAFVAGISQDITERVSAEKEIERLNVDLAVRAAELEEANRELEAFSYSVAHDLRKPLTIVNGYCEVLRDLCGGRLDEQCRTYLQEAYDGTWRMNRLIDTLLNFSRMARVELQRETVDLSDMAQAVANELQLTETARRATFRIAKGISAIGDANLLRVVLENLLGNAWKYTGMREEAVIEFGATQQDGMSVFFIRDNGPGFAPEDAEKLFLPFQRLPGAEEFRGFGIGLATVDRIVRRHGGRVWAEGEPGKGATFRFTLGTGNQAGKEGPTG